MQVVFDIEADSLTPTVIHVLVAKDIDTGKVYSFRDAKSFSEFFNNVDLWIGHNIISFDIPVLARLWGYHIPRNNVLDTLVLSKLLKYKLDDGHSLDAWGKRLKHPKTEFSDWSSYSDLMLKYCINDVELNYKVYLYLKKKILDRDTFKEAVRLEHHSAFVCYDMHQTGFPFNYEEAKKMHKELEEILNELDQHIKKEFPPKSVPVREITPRLTKHGTLRRNDFRWYDGTDYSIFHEDSPFTLFSYEEFNPNSPKQVVEKLNEAGWKPTEKTTGYLEALKQRPLDRKKLENYKLYGWKVSEKNLDTLPDGYTGACRILLKRLFYETRKRKLEEWFKAYNPSTGRIHGTYNSIGAWTHRKSHVAPNMANIAAEKSIKYKSKELSDLAMHYGKRMRELWIAEKGKVLVGTDAEGIQLRIFAHLIKDQKFVDAIVAGDKSLGTDVHSLNRKALGDICKTRDNAKTFIYAFLLGVGLGETVEIFGCFISEAEIARDNFIKAYPGLAELKAKRIPLEAKRGYLDGVDGRFIVTESEHLTLGGHLQSGESIVMKKACEFWIEELQQKGIPFELVNDVHDEWVTQCEEEHADTISAIQKESIKKAGEYFNLFCPMAGSSSIGKNWYEIH